MIKILSKTFIRVFIISTTLLWLALGKDALAGHEKFNMIREGNTVVPGLQFSVEDDKFGTMGASTAWQQEFDNYKTINRISLSIDPFATKYQPQAYTAEVKLSITYYTYNQAGSSFTTQTKSATLKVNYELLGIHNDKTVIQFEGGHKMDIRVVSITPSPGSVPMNLVLEGEIEVDRYYNFDPNALTQAGKVNHDDSFLADQGELQVSWTAVGAEEYDLEWTYVNNTAIDGTLLAPENIALEDELFKFNSTRITTTSTSYRIPLVYEPGYILYRVRAVGRSKASGYKLNTYSNWSSSENCTNVSCFPGKYLFAGHEKSLNWQYSANYAEEGKSKVAVSYFDGSLRNRQVVSKLNTEKKAIIGETIYDYQGRGAIQVLPVPVEAQKIKYYNRFNQNKNGEVYSRSDFDLDQSCKIIAGEMSTISGASNYYSAANPSKTGHQAYLPDAKKYPFTQTQYTPDNTGRIRAQTGVGSDHQLSSGHETKYFYATPAQEELDRFFGSEVGDAVRYKKNMVRDANGQISVSYLDPQGRVIATALAGETPDQLEALPTSAIQTMNVDLLNKTRPTDKSGSKNYMSLDSRSLFINDQKTVSTRSTWNFNYKLEGNTYLNGCQLGGISKSYPYPGVLDLSISLKDECGNEYLTGVNGLTLGTTSTAPVYTKSWSSNGQLEPGSYTLNKTLSINQAALDTYTREYFAKNECVISFSSFLAEENGKIDLLACNLTCEECKNRVGVYPSWANNPYNKEVNPNCSPCITESEYDQLLEGCSDLCDEGSINCKSALEAMLADVSPMGQYGEFLGGQTIDPVNVSINTDGSAEPEVESTSIDVSKHPLSVFNINNKLPVKTEQVILHIERKIRPNWKHPFFIDKGQNKRFQYVDEFGNQSYISLTKIDDNTFSPAADLSRIEFSDDQVYRVKPQYLTDVKDFIMNWQDSWAQSLVRYHPEYSYYEFCSNNQASHDFDYKWISTGKLEEALNYGYMNNTSYFPNPLGDLPAQAIDPYFNSTRPGFNQLEYDAMKRGMQKYASDASGIKSLWQIVNATVNCPYWTNSNACPNDNCYDTKINSDEEWDRFKSFYISLKQKFQQVSATKYAINNDAYNGCIGNDKFDPFSNNFFRTSYDESSTIFGNPVFFNKWRSQYYNWEQPCNWVNHKLYEKKTKRFPQYNDLPKEEFLDLNYCYDEISSGEYEVTDCPEKNIALVREMEAEADRKLYEECGQCPTGRDLQVLLNAIAKRKELTTNNLPLSCYPNSNYVEFVPDLNILIAGTGNVTWKVKSSGNYTHNGKSGKKLEVELERATGEKCSLTLITKPGSTFDFNDLTRVCCLTYKISGTILPFAARKNFSLKGYIISTSGAEQEVDLEGVSSCFQVGECQLAPRCAVSETGKDLQSLFNGLLALNQLSGSNISLNGLPYDAIIKDLYNLADDATLNHSWKAGIIANVLEAQLSNGAGSCLVDLILPAGATFSFSNIISFSGIRPDTDPAKWKPDGSTPYFLITALVDFGTAGKKYVQMSGYSPCTELTVGSCLPALTKVKLSSN